MKEYSDTTPALERAQRNLEQAKARYEEERKKANAKRRKEENHHKYLMGGIIVKYFPECYQYNEQELNVILSAALNSVECHRALQRVNNQDIRQT